MHENVCRKIYIKLSTIFFEVDTLNKIEVKDIIKAITKEEC
jgi:hypothetical protein